MNLGNVSRQAAQASLVLVFFAFPMSVALANVALLLTLVFWAVGLGWADARLRLQEALRNPLALPALALFGWIIVAAAWSPASPSGVLGFVQKYLKFLLVPMFIALLHDAPVRRRCWQAFALALAFTLAVTWLNVWFDFGWTRTQNQGLGVDHTVFKDYISQGLMMTLFTLMAGLVAIMASNPALRWAAALVWFMASLSILLLSAGRTGYIAWAAATVVFAVTLAATRSTRAMLSTVVGVAAVVGLSYTASPVLQQRLLTAWSEAQTVTHDAANGVVTSAGARIEMTEFTLQGSLDAPLLGHGTAAYPVLAAKHFTDPVWCSVVCPHPHNQFLFFLYEQGIVGLALFLWFAGAIVREAMRHEPGRRAFALAFVAVLSVVSLSHSSFWLSTESHCLVLMSALVMAGLHRRRMAGRAA